MNQDIRDKYNIIMDKSSYVTNLIEVELSKFDLESYFHMEYELLDDINKLLKQLQNEEKEFVSSYYTQTLKIIKYQISHNKKIKYKFNNMKRSDEDNFEITSQELHSMNEERLKKNAKNILASEELRLKYMPSFAERILRVDLLETTDDTYGEVSAYVGFTIDTFKDIGEYSPMLSIIQLQQFEKENTLDLYYSFMVSFNIVLNINSRMKYSNSCFEELKLSLNHELNYRINKCCHHLAHLRGLGMNIEHYVKYMSYILGEDISDSLVTDERYKILESSSIDLFDELTFYLENEGDSELSNIANISKEYFETENTYLKQLLLSQMYNYLDKISYLICVNISGARNSRSYSLKYLLDNKLLNEDEPNYRYVKKLLQLVNKSSNGKHYNFSMSKAEIIRNANTHHWGGLYMDNMDEYFKEINNYIYAYYATIKSIPKFDFNICQKN